MFINDEKNHSKKLNLMLKLQKSFHMKAQINFFFSVSKWVKIRVAVSQWFALVTNTYQLVNLLRFALLLLLLLLVASTTETLTIKSVVLEIALNFI